MSLSEDPLFSKLHNKDHTMDPEVSGMILCYFFSFSINPSYFKLIERKLSFFVLQSSKAGRMGTEVLKSSFLRKSNVKCCIRSEIGKSKSIGPFVNFPLFIKLNQIETKNDNERKFSSRQTLKIVPVGTVFPPKT